MNQRHYSTLDNLIVAVDQYWVRLFRMPVKPDRPYPAADVDEGVSDERERRRSAALMRVNHAGEVAAQALYKAQALTARSHELRRALANSAEEERAHLVWCEMRLRELGGHTSYFDPVWFVGSLTIGVVAGLCGDEHSLGFVMETENQVVVHLDKHREQLAVNDLRSRAIIEQMRVDEANHASVASHAGAPELPVSVKKMMRLCSKVMITTAYWI